ncbi:HTH-type transcriptional regulator RafR [Pseudoruegeria aquimaris]|uniref:HTH-type transcriptional regulator RafR n=1 Tax=Pseudoruegeria aquimaris TaxID=393663 RepID=A0A1Y5S311_9RHOB|nr:substrate-binding domain-containing protein [Pseudoruegeria aquimaris]SLN31580.1 HTH-type transcriptional regulator RafR [Pseudoruegeria aquimaris]
MANLKDLAEHLGLSQATVSRALNGYSTVNAETRRKVQEAARLLNYRPNTSARRLATGRAGAFGLVLEQSDNLLNDPHFVDFLSGFTQELAAQDLDVVLTSAEGLATYRRYASTSKVDGFVISAPKVKDARVAALTEMAFPFVVHGQTEADAPYAFYDIANERAFLDATRLLLNLGHRRIALINGPADTMFARQRLDGFHKALAEKGLPPDPRLIHHATMSEDEGYALTRQLFAGSEAPTAILCSSTLQTLGLTRRLREEGLEMGRDVSVISHDDGLSSMKTENFSVPLTVTRAPIREAGQEIARMLVALGNGASVETQQKTAPVELIVRASTSAAPQE